MREIKFRGQDKKGVWHYGYLWKSPDGIFYIKELVSKLHSTDIEVVKESVGQFTGLKDKNGKEIYEGDIIFDLKIKEKGEIDFGRHPFFQAFMWHKIYDEDEVRREEEISYFIISQESVKEFEVIGNKFENPCKECKSKSIPSIPKNKMKTEICQTIINEKTGEICRHHEEDHPLTHCEFPNCECKKFKAKINQGCGKQFERDSFSFQCGEDYSNIPRRNFGIELCKECNSQGASSPEGRLNLDNPEEPLRNKQESSGFILKEKRKEIKDICLKNFKDFKRGNFIELFEAIEKQDKDFIKKLKTINHILINRNIRLSNMDAKIWLEGKLLKEIDKLVGELE